jgi:RimJ/RimL family protein N-acetyltransferase
MIPTLVSERLVLRPFRDADLDRYAAFWASDQARFVGGPCGRADAWRKMAMYAGHWLLRGYGIWALEAREGGVFLGQAGLWCPEGWPEPEIHWLLMADATGRGYATEAARRVRDHARDDLGWRTAVSCIDPANLASLRVARRLGAVPEGEARVGDRHFILHRHPMRAGDAAMPAGG